MIHLKQIAIATFILLILAQAGMKTGIVVYYYANKATIAKNLCEKRNEPKSCCAGSCQVKKWLKDAEQPDPSQQTPAGPNLKTIQELVLFVESVPAFAIFVHPLIQDEVPFPAYTCTGPLAPVREIFHPPS